MAEMPIGFEAAKAAWDEKLAGRPMTLDDWNSLTFGDHARYGAQECKTKGAVYTSHVSRSEVTVKIALPENLAMNGLTEGEAREIERKLHKTLEEAVYWILRWRQITSGNG